MVDLKAIYDGLTDSEKHGLAFGLFPLHMTSLNLTHDQEVGLIRIAADAKEKKRVLR